MPADFCPAGGERMLTAGEIALAQSVFGEAIDYRVVQIRRRKWFPLQPLKVVMAPLGHIHFHPHSPSYCDDFSKAPLSQQGLFIHELVHVWQVQTKGRWYLVLKRPFSRRYDYCLRPGWPLERYGLEQQAEIVRHAFLIRAGAAIHGAPHFDAYRPFLDFD